MFELIADGIPWEDMDGQIMWPEREAITLAAALETIGYEVTLEKVTDHVF